jgi:hypothetical protein
MGQANSVFNEARKFEETVTSLTCVRHISRSLASQAALAVFIEVLRGHMQSAQANFDMVF